MIQNQSSISIGYPINSPLSSAGSHHCNRSIRRHHHKPKLRIVTTAEHKKEETTRETVMQMGGYYNRSYIHSAWEYGLVSPGSRCNLQWGLIHTHSYTLGYEATQEIAWLWVPRCWINAHWTIQLHKCGLNHGIWS